MHERGQLSQEKIKKKASSVWCYRSVVFSDQLSVGGCGGRGWGGDASIFIFDNGEKGSSGDR